MFKSNQVLYSGMTSYHISVLENGWLYSSFSQSHGASLHQGQAMCRREEYLYFIRGLTALVMTLKDSKCSK